LFLVLSLVVVSAAFAGADASTARHAKRVRHHVAHSRKLVRRPPSACLLRRVRTTAIRARTSGHNVAGSAACATLPSTGTESPGPTGGGGGAGGGGSSPPITQPDQPPPAIASQGYQEVFRDNFDTLNRAVWDDHIWYDESPNPLWTPGFQEADSSGILHLRTRRDWIGDTGQPYPYSTITTQSSGRTFQYGYFEARMKWSQGDGAWPGFWLYSYQHALDEDQCKTQGGELDVMEGQGSEPDIFYGTVHSNTNGCSPDDHQNGNNYQEVGTDLTQSFHTYAALWTATTVSWYLDDKLIMSAPTYATDNQPMFVLLQMWTGGWTKDPDATTPDTIETQVDWVRVWQKSS
jgi:beta-glucanase (GH16 family)